MIAPEYIRDPAEIYQKSFQIVESEADLERFPTEMRSVAKRLVHSCGMVDILNDLQFSDRAVEAAKSALLTGCEVFCDVEMVKAGIIQGNLPEKVEIICTLNDPRVRDRAKQIRNTRSAAAVEFWSDLDGSIVVIGNAPTALFHLLDRIAAGGSKPALIIGAPVGFVGAAESKDALALNSLGIEFITVHGRRGGSAMASAILNGLAKLV